MSYLNDEVPVVQGGQPNGANPEVHELTKNARSAEVREDIHADVIVIGAGFSGITAIDRLRKQGLTVKCFESGDSFGGVWYWNRRVA